METENKTNLKVGDKVKLGLFGYFDTEEPYTIISMKASPLFLGGVQYELENESGRKITAYADEVEPYS